MPNTFFQGGGEFCKGRLVPPGYGPGPRIYVRVLSCTCVFLVSAMYACVYSFACEDVVQCNISVYLIRPKTNAPRKFFVRIMWNALIFALDVIK